MKLWFTNKLGKVVLNKKTFEVHLERLEELSQRVLVGTECRGSNGRAEADIPTLEIVKESKQCYSEVLDLIKQIESSTDRGVV